MADLLTLLPVIILAISSLFRSIDGKLKKYWWAVLLYSAGMAGTWGIVRIYASMPVTDLIILTLLVLVSFELLHVRNHKMSLPFHLLFLVTVFITAGSAFIYPEALLCNEFLLLLIYFLTDSNQRYLKRTYEESSALYQNMLLTKQVNEVQNMYMTMRGWRHDYHNHLQTLKAHLKLNQVEEARVYLDKLELDLDNIHKLIESGNVNLDAILNSKLSLALKNNIVINYKAAVPDRLTVSDIDLCVLIGNLIDNAVESCDRMTETDGEKFIRLYIGVLKKQLYISVTNATNEVIRKFDEDYITTKRGNHGHGLKRINNIIEKYEGYINRKNEPGVFVTEIMLPL